VRGGRGDKRVDGGVRGGGAARWMGWEKGGVGGEAVNMGKGGIGPEKGGRKGWKLRVEDRMRGRGEREG